MPLSVKVAIILMLLIAGMRRTSAESVPLTLSANTFGWPDNYCATGAGCTPLPSPHPIGDDAMECRVQPNVPGDTNQGCTFRQSQSQTFDAREGFQFSANLQVPVDGLPKGTNLVGGTFITEIPGAEVNGSFVPNPDGWAIQRRVEFDLAEVFANASQARSNFIVFNGEGGSSFTPDSQVVPNIDVTQPFSTYFTLRPDTKTDTFTATWEYFQNGELRAQRQQSNVVLDIGFMSIRANAWATPPGSWNGETYLAQDAYFSFGNATLLIPAPPAHSTPKDSGSSSEAAIGAGAGAGAGALLLFGGITYVLYRSKKGKLCCRSASNGIDAQLSLSPSDISSIEMGSSERQKRQSLSA